MSVFLSPVGGAGAQFFDNNGNPLSGGKLYTYAAGTTTPQATYTSSAGSTLHTNPIILNAGGRVPDSGEIWLADGQIYKFVLKTSADVLLATWDNITGVNSNFVNYTTETEVQTATAGQTVFTLTTMSYAPATGSLTVYVDGVNQYEGTSYVETDSTTVTFTAGLHVGAEVKFTTAVQTTGNATDASVVSYMPPFTGSVGTTVEDKLAQYVSVLDFGAVGDDSTDDRAAIQAAIDSGAKTVLLPSGYDFIISDTIYLPSDFTLVVDGDLRLAPNTPDAVAMIMNSDRVTRQNNIHITGTGRIDGNKANQQTGVEIRQVCIDFLCVAGCTITVAEVGNNKWNNAYPTSPANLGGSCISILDARFCKVSGVLLYRWEHEGISIDRDLFASSGDCYGNVVENCTCEGSGAASYSAVQMGGTGAYNNRVSGIIARNTGASAVGVDSTNSVVDCITVHTTQYFHGLNLGHTGAPASGTSVSNIQIYNTGASASSGNHNGINVGGGSTNVTISNATIDTTYSNGVNVSDSASSVILSNIKVLNAGGYGFNLYAANDTKLIGCYATGSGSGELNIGGGSTGVEYIVTGESSIPTMNVGTELVTPYINMTSTGALRVDDILWVYNTNATANAGLRPYTDNNLKLGYTTNRWSEVYAGNGTINTSDRNQKQQIEELSDAEMRVAKSLKSLVRKFKWNDAVEKKGSEARTHVGVIAQDVYDAFAAEGLNANTYGVFCSDTVYVDSDGGLHENFGDGLTSEQRLGVRYDQLFAFIIAAI